MEYFGLICNNEQEFMEMTGAIPGVLSRSYSKNVIWNVTTKTCQYKLVNKPTNKFKKCLKYPNEVIEYVPPVIKVKPEVISYSDEIWQDYKGYRVSTYGRVINKWGNLAVQFLQNGRWYVSSEPVHVIMAKVFLKKNHPSNRFVDHIDGEVLNNHIDNLKWRKPIPKSNFRTKGQPKWLRIRSYEKLWIRLLNRRDNPPLKRKSKYYYKPSVATKRICPHCQTEFLAKGKKVYCKSSHTPAAYNAKSMRKRLSEGSSKRIPKWEDRLLLARFVKNKPIGAQVDHIIPLNHPDVCGLHCRDNLQYLTPEENQFKSNRFDGTKENEGWRLLPI